MRQAIVPGLLLLLASLTGCSDSGSGSSSETVDLFLLDDVAGQTHRMEEQHAYRLRIYGGSYDNSVVTSWQWIEQPIQAGAFGSCGDQQNFDVQLAARNLQGACTAAANCVLSFDQVSSADIDSDGLSVFTVDIPSLRAPVGVKYRVEGTHENGQVVASNHTFCLVSVNEPPLASDDAYTVTEGVQRVVGQVGGNLLTNDADDIDVSNQELTVSLISAPQLSAEFSLETDGSFTYLYTGDLAGGQILQDSFQYQVSDGFNTDVATVNLTIVTSDKPPEIVNPIPEIIVESGVALEIDLAGNFIDPEGGDLFFSIVDLGTLPTSGNVTLSQTGVLSGIPTLGDAGSYTATVSVTDQISTVESPFVLTITENLPPSATTLADITVDFGQLISVDAAAAFSDPEGVALTYRLQSTPASTLSINSVTGLITGQVATDGEYQITVFASDGLNAEVSSTFTLVQLPIPNRAPVLLTDIPNQTIQLGQPIDTVVPDFLDPDGDELTFEAISGLAGLSFNTSSGILSGTPTVLGSVSITLVATDPEGLTGNSNTFVITVTEVPNQPPVFSNSIADQTGNIGEPISPISGTFSDPEVEPLVYSATTLPSGLELDSTTGVISGTPTQIFSDTVTITATDPDGESVSSNAFSLLINPRLNSIPVFNSQIANVNLLVGDAASITTPSSAFSDPDDDPLTLSLSPASGVLPPGLAIGASGIISGTPTQVGTFGGIVIQATDGSEAVESNAFSITVSEQPNSAPEFAGPIPDVTRTVGVATTVTTIAGQFSDSDLDALVFSLAPSSGALPTGLSLGSDGVISGTPGVIGTSAGLIVVASDGESSVESNAFSITITAAPNTAPEFDGVIGNFSATVGTLFSESSISAAFSDADADPLTYTLASGSGNLPPGITLNAAGELTGTPTTSGSFSGIRVEASDGSDSVESNLFSIVVADPPNTGPEFTGSLVDPAGTVGVAFSLATIADQFSDVDNDPLTFSLATSSDDLPPGLILASSGLLSGTPTLAGTYAGIVVAASDGSDTALSPAFTIVISPAPNIAPEFDGTIFNNTSAVAGVPFTMNTIAPRFSDEDGDTLMFALVPDANSNFGFLPPGLTLSSSGVISGTPTLAGTYRRIRISASDGLAQAVSNRFLITVAPALNSPPEFSGAINDISAQIDFAVIVTTIPTLFTDDDAGDTLIYSMAPTSTALPTGFSLSPAGVLTGTSAIPVSVEGLIVEASDGTDSAFSNAFDLTIAAAPNSPPEFSGSISDINEMVDVTVNVTTIASLFTDNDAGDTLVYSMAATSADLPLSFSISPAGVISGTSDVPLAVSGLIVEASDGTDSAFSNAFDLTISAAANNPPEFDGTVGVITLELDEPVSITSIAAAFSDDDNDTLEFELATGSEDLPDDLVLDPDTGTISGSPAAVGTFADIIISATDGLATATTNPFTIEVSATANTPPVFSGIIVNQFGSVGLPLVLDVVASEFTDSDPLTYMLAIGSPDLPDGLILDASTGEITGTPLTAGTVSGISIEASDGVASAVTNTFDFLINTPPEFVGPILAQIGVELEDFSIDLSGFFSDDDNDLLDYSLSSGSTDLPDGLELDSSTGEISGIPLLPGTVTGIQIEASDGIDSVASNSFGIDILVALAAGPVPSEPL